MYISLEYKIVYEPFLYNQESSYLLKTAADIIKWFSDLKQ